MGTQLPLPNEGTTAHQIFGPCLLCPNDWIDQGATSYGGRPRPNRHHVRWGPSSPSQKGGSALNFWSMSIVAKRLHGSICHLYGARPRLRPHCARWPTQLPFSKRGHSPPIFSPCLLWPNGWMDQGATWYDGLPRPDNIVLDVDPAPPPRAQPLNFGPCLLCPNGWMDQDATWYEGRPWPRPHCVTWEPSSPLPEVAQPP